MPERPAIVFDVNETLMSLDPFRPTFDRIFNDSGAMRLWFASLINYSEALTLSGVYIPFTGRAGAVLRMLAATCAITVTDAAGAELTDWFAAIAPDAEVPAALRRLRDHGFGLVTLTGNPLGISGRQLEYGGAIDVFERRFSVGETVKRHKPARETYKSVAAALERDPHDTCLVACPVWDTMGRSIGRLAGRAHPARRQRPARRPPAAGLHRERSRCDRRPADREVRRRWLRSKLAEATARPAVTALACPRPSLITARRDGTEMVEWDNVTREDVLHAIRDYDRLGPDQFFSQHGFGQSRSYELVWDKHHYPHKAILGTAYELATGHRLAPGDFEGGKSGAVKVLGNLGFTVQPLR